LTAKEAVRNKKAQRIARGGTLGMFF